MSWEYGLLLGLLGIPVTILSLGLILYCIGQSDSSDSEKLKEKDLSTLERFWRDFDK